jgi:hypothetical protein
LIADDFFRVWKVLKGLNMPIQEAGNELLMGGIWRYIRENWQIRDSLRLAE